MDAIIEARAREILDSRGNPTLEVDVLLDLNYGRILEVKIALVIATVALTALHSFVVGPRLLRLQESVADEAQIASTRRSSIIISASNLVLALGILFAAALLNTNFALE